MYLKLDELKDKHMKRGDKIDIFYGFLGAGDLELKTQCFMHINHIFIDCSGDVYLCCHYLDKKKDLKIGNIHKASLKKIWFSKRHMQVAKGTKIHECNKVDCRWIKYNNYMEPFLSDKNRPLDFI